MSFVSQVIVKIMSAECFLKISQAFDNQINGFFKQYKAAFFLAFLLVSSSSNWHHYGINGA
jgi:hypothetical protein